ncbi:hypothetical protein [Lysinibacter sp. HNR]|uniref:hypothetical protein n=1 Tax=Lysinibacter sp. HNR TaxID=3031408 RepID=UPI002434A350|nr:hypothetical protein [Lysinibacter sp. HNR]WGD37107.1 hypothetical protein FrondiHNR_11805 [Lysinibacter sp. HNR]
MRRYLLTPVTLAAAAALVLSGCSTGSTEKKTTENSPLAAYVGKAFQPDEAKLKAQQKEVEEAVAVCMADQGFTYTPNTDTSHLVGADLDSDFYKGRGTLEWAEKNGYGVTTQASSQDSEEPTSNPDEEYLASLSEDEREAYDIALFGAPSGSEEGDSPDEGSSAEEFDPATAGCHQNATREIMSEGIGEAFTDPTYTELMEQMGTLQEKVMKDPAYLAARKQWGECLADAGYPDVEGVEGTDAFELVLQKQNELYGLDDTDSSGNPAQPTQQQLKELADYEIQVATADFKCGEKTKANEILLDLQYKLEEEFIAKNKAKLDSFIATYGNK